MKPPRKCGPCRGASRKLRISRGSRKEPVHGTDAAGFQEALINLALVRGTFGDGNDARFIRGRIAFMLWLPGLLLLLILGVEIQSPVVVAVGIPGLLVALWVFVIGGRGPMTPAETYRTHNAARL